MKYSSHWKVIVSSKMNFAEKTLETFASEQCFHFLSKINMKQITKDNMHIKIF